MEKYAEAVEDLTEAYRLKASPEAFSALDDAKRRKTKAESRKPSHYQVTRKTCSFATLLFLTRFLVWTRELLLRRLRKLTEPRLESSTLINMPMLPRRSRLVSLRLT